MPMCVTLLCLSLCLLKCMALPPYSGEKQKVVLCLYSGALFCRKLWLYVTKTHLIAKVKNKKTKKKVKHKCFVSELFSPLVTLLCHLGFNFRRPLVPLLLRRSVWLKSWGELEAMIRKGTACGVLTLVFAAQLFACLLTQSKITCSLGLLCRQGFRNTRSYKMFQLSVCLCKYTAII